MLNTSDKQGTIVLRRSRLYDYAALTKPELTLLSVSTAVCAAYLGVFMGTSYLILLKVFVGTLLVGAGAGVLNEYLEREYDAMMKRTSQRPLPSGRVQPSEALGFGFLLAAAGITFLALFTNLTAAILGGLTLLIYLFIYTPLKRITPLATVVGAIPGAMPPMIGWVASRGSITIEGWSLFFVLFFWQIPHFLSLVWVYRRDYEQAGYMTVSADDKDGEMLFRHIVIYCTALIPAALATTLVGLSGSAYFFSALILSGGFLGMAIWLYFHRSRKNAHRLFYASLAYLSAIMLLLMLDRAG